MFNQLTIKTDWRLTKAAQIAKAVKKMIQEGGLNKNEQLPSINHFSRQYGVARDTVEKAYKVLKNEGYINAVKGKGYFVTSRNKKEFKILLVLNEWRFYQNRKHDMQFFEPVNMINIDLRVHQNDLRTFKKIILENLASYQYYYIVLPRYNSTIKQKQVNTIVRLIPESRRLILEKMDDIGGV